MIDSIRHISTPEGVELELRVAGVYVRGAAYLVDFIIWLVLWIVISMALAIFGAFGVGVSLVVMFVVGWFYPVYFEVMRDGATPGKKMFGICVVNSNGTPVGWGASITRSLLRCADLLPIAFLLGIVVMTCDRSSRRIGDLAAGTLVVYRQRKERTVELPEVDPVLPPVSLHQHEQRAILEFAERCDDWAPKRQQELANILEPLTGERDKVGVQQLAGIATHLVGGR